MKDCPLNGQIKVSKKIYVFVGKEVGIHKNAIYMGQEFIKNMGWKSLFLLFNIENRKFYEVLPFPLDQAIPFTYSCSFTLDTSYNMACQIKGGKAVKFLKPKLLYKQRAY